MAWAWETSTRPLSPPERDALLPALTACGADASLLDLYGTTVASRGRWTRPVWVRATERGRLKGVALVVLCRDAGVSFFGRSRLGRLARAGPPLWYWDRTAMGTDGIACPGFAVDGVHLEDFADEAVRMLSRRLVGSMLDVRAPAAPHVAHPFVGTCTVALDHGERPAERALRHHRNLPRKVRRFRARGGTVERVHGRMPAPLRGPLMSGYALHRPINPPFAEHYPQLVQAHWDRGDERSVHLVARLGDQPVGYHSFWQAGGHLCMLSGVVGRREGGTAHAYESLLLGSLDLAADLGCRRLDLGPGVNAAKVSVLGCRPTTLYLVSRRAVVRSGLAALLPRSDLAVGTLEAARGPL